jgi:signal transduction histidine kinase
MRQYSKVLMDDYGDRLDDQGRFFLERIADSSLRLDRLVQEVLAYSRIVRGDLVPRRVDTAGVIREVIRQNPSLQPGAADIEIQEPLLPMIGQEVFLTQCISNLLTNAVKFVAPGVKPRVRIRTERRAAGPAEGMAGGGAPSASRVRLWIEDNGIGIAPQHQERIFGMFERVHGGNAYEGTGIGLAIVSKAVQRMGGSVGVESRPGEGSRFWIELGEFAGAEMPA